MANAPASYFPDQLATSSLMQVRLLIGDTITTAPQFADAEITYFLSMRTNVYGASAECCNALAAQYARSVDQAAGNQKISYSQMSKAYAGRALQFEAQAAAAGSAVPYAGGISEADKLSQ